MIGDNPCEKLREKEASQSFLKSGLLSPDPKPKICPIFFFIFLRITPPIEFMYFEAALAASHKVRSSHMT